MAEFKQIEIVGEEEFWARDPAPGTVFIEIANGKMELVGSEIDVEVDDPDNAVMVSGVGSASSPEGYAVLEWGSWETPANLKIRELRDEARRLMAEELIELEKGGLS